MIYLLGIIHLVPLKVKIKKNCETDDNGIWINLGDKSKQKSLGPLELSTRALITSIDIDTVDDQIVAMQMMTNLVDTTKKVNTAIQAKELLKHHIYVR